MLKSLDCFNMKFRGVELAINRIIVGDTVLIENGEVTIIFDKDGNAHEMQVDSVKQYLFTDAHGNDVYEGDYIGYVDDENYVAWTAYYGDNYCPERLELRRANYEY